jgi:hypothetical protein
MRFGKSFVAWISCLAVLSLAPLSAAGNEFLLVGGIRATIEGKQLILIDRNDRRSVAPAGKYDTPDGKYSIFVRGNGISIRDNTKEPR